MGALANIPSVTWDEGWDIARTGILVAQASGRACAYPTCCGFGGIELIAQDGLNAPPTPRLVSAGKLTTWPAQLFDTGVTARLAKSHQRWSFAQGIAGERVGDVVFRYADLRTLTSPKWAARADKPDLSTSKSLK